MRAEAIRNPPAPPPVREFVLHLSPDEARVLYAVANVNMTVGREVARALATFPAAYNPGVDHIQRVVGDLFIALEGAGVPHVDSLRNVSGR